MQIKKMMFTNNLDCLSFYTQYLGTCQLFGLIYIKYRKISHLIDIILIISF